MKLILYKRLISSIKRSILTLSLVFILLSLSNCTENSSIKKNDEIANIIITPSPAKILYKRGHLKIDKTTRILLNLSDKFSNNYGKYLIDDIFKKTKLKLKIADRFTTKKINSGIEIILGNFKEIKPEGFKVVVSNNRIKIVANDLSGVHYASNVVISLIHKNGSSWSSAQISIEDYPKANARGIFINLNDSLIDKPQLIQLLKNNRINYVITQKKWKISSDLFLNIQDTASFSLQEHKNSMKYSSIKSIYTAKKKTNDSILFEINNATMLHPDSIKILGEAMWTKDSKRDYEKIFNHLETQRKDLN